MRHKILHIPSGEIFIVIGAKTKNIVSFKKEFEICMYYTRTPVGKDNISVHQLKERTYRRLRYYKFNYSKMDLERIHFWIASFSSFAANVCLNKKYDEAIHLKTEWASIIPEEFEIIE